MKTQAKYNRNKYSLYDKIRFVSFMSLYGLVKYVPTPAGDLLRGMVLKLFAKKVKSYSIKDGATFWFPWGISIGRNVSVNEYCYFDCYGGIEIGDWTRIAHNCSFVSEDHGIEEADIPIYYQKKEGAKIVIGQNVWFGCGVRVLKGVKIGDGAVIGAGAVVTKDIPAGGVAVGVPATVIRYRGDEARGGQAGSSERGFRSE